MEAIIHPGMHKTGSSSIQAALVAIKPDGWILPDAPSGNMSGLFVLFFEDNPHEHHSFKARGMSAEDVQKVRSKRFENFERQVQEGVEKGFNSIFTGEHISMGSRKGVERLADFYRTMGYTPRVVAYVRRPMSFIQSAFQQRIKGNLRTLDEKSGLWPMYRDRFEKMDEIFGSENVDLQVFDSDKLIDGDVCVDFFHRIGSKLQSEQVVRVNEGMPLSALALLFAQRNLGEGYVQGFNGAAEKNNQFIARLSGLSGLPLKFKRSFVTQMFEARREDLEWMEERLGMVLSDLPDEDDPEAVGSAEDLLAIADCYRDQLEELLIAEIRRDGEQPRDRLIRNLELLRKLYY